MAATEKTKAQLLEENARLRAELDAMRLQAGCNEYVVMPFDKSIVAKKLTKLGFHVHLF